MSVQESLGRLLRVGLALLLVALVVGQVLGQPVLLGFVRTGSMAPTLAPNDGFVAVPDVVAGDPERGDVIVYRATEIQGGGLTTHRVVSETNRGYVTKGDANAVTDQAAGEPPVQRHQIVAHALQVNRETVVIPALGTAITLVHNVASEGQMRLARALNTDVLVGTSGLLYLFGAVTIGYAVVTHLGGSTRSRDRTRSRDQSRGGVDPRYVVVGLSLLLAVGIVSPMVLPAGTHEVSIVSARFDSERTNVIRAGESTTTVTRFDNPGVLPHVVYVEPGDGVTVERRVVHIPPRSSETVALVVDAPERTGAYRRFFTTYRYLGILPKPALTALYRLHPWLPIGAVTAVVVGPFAAVGYVLAGQQSVRQRSRRRNRSKT